MRRASIFLSLLLTVLVGCSKPPQQASDDSSSTAAPFSSDSKNVTLPSGTTITVKLSQAVGSKISNTGDSFTASVAQPVQINGNVVVPAGSAATGHVLEAAPEGRFKGGAVLRLALDSITVNDSKYDIASAPVSRSL